MTEERSCENCADYLIEKKMTGGTMGKCSISIKCDNFCCWQPKDKTAEDGLCSDCWDSLCSKCQEYLVKSEAKIIAKRNAEIEKEIKDKLLCLNSGMLNNFWNDGYIQMGNEILKIVKGEK